MGKYNHIIGNTLYLLVNLRKLGEEIENFVL